MATMNNKEKIVMVKNMLKMKKAKKDKKDKKKKKGKSKRR